MLVHASMQRKPTMHDVARAAGVGTMTVSRVLNGSEHVAKETAERVMRAVSKLGYHPNEMARALRNFKSRSIGLIVPSLHDSFFATCAHAVNLVAKEHGYSVLITTSDDKADTEYLQAQQMMQRHVEGLAIIPAGIGHCRMGEAAFSAIPIVALDRPVKNAEIDSVVVENERGAYTAVSHLIEGHGHRRILLLGFPRGLYTMQLRAAGYTRAMRHARLEPDRDFTCGSLEAAIAILRKALAGAEPPTALFCANNVITLHALRALQKLQVQVPSDLAVVSFDDLDLGDTLYPALTVVRQPVLEMGQAAAHLLFSRIGGERSRTDEAVHTVLGVEFLLRRSCGCTYDQSGEAIRIAVAPGEAAQTKPQTKSQTKPKPKSKTKSQTRPKTLTKSRTSARKAAGVKSSTKKKTGP